MYFLYLGLVIALFEALSDKDESVRDMVLSSLYAIGIHEPIMLLETAHGFLSSRHARVSHIYISKHTYQSNFLPVDSFSPSHFTECHAKGVCRIVICHIRRVIFTCSKFGNPRDDI